jgi:hypothetical protein
MSTLLNIAVQCAKMYSDPDPSELQQQQQQQQAETAATGASTTATSSSTQQQQQQYTMTHQAYAECMHGVMTLLGRQRVHTGEEQSEPEPHERMFFKFQNSRCVSGVLKPCVRL